ncbi:MULTISPECIES: hypothetical protein [Achromobacter]|uniref:hypothetical protein n=1 Tax=Achromobacter TaxID=222 RepID=UPI0025BE6C7E|nr:MULTISPECIES: hypothetical protein [Achromobacter]
MIDLKPFCGRDDPREFLNHPWQEDGATYASNGHIGIQVDVVQPDAPAVSATMAGRIQKLLAEARANTIPLDIKFPDVAPKPCPRCEGRGFVIAVECDECEGDGWFEHGSHNYDCKECNASGEIVQPAGRADPKAEECWSCDGNGTVSTHVHLHANGITYGFQEKYLRRIATLPAVRLFVSSDNSAAARFDFEGGSGVLMPVRV